jgi:hypothetical protein
VHKSATAGCEQASGRQDGYARRRPEETALYQCVAEYWPEFTERMTEHGGLPSFVEEEFDAYLVLPSAPQSGCTRLSGNRVGLAPRAIASKSWIIPIACTHRVAKSSGFFHFCLSATRTA